MSLPPGFQSWAARLVESLLPLDPDSISQIIKVAATEQGGPEGAGRYLKELLGESEEALDFIAEFTRRLASTSTGLAPPLGGGSRGGSGSNTPNSRSRPITPVPTPPPGKQQQQTGWSVSESAPLSKRNLHGGGGGSRGGRGGKMGYKQELRKPAEVDESSGLKVYRKNDEEESYYSGGKKAGGGSDSGATTPKKVGHAGTLQGGKEVGNGNPVTTTTAPPQQKQPKLAGTLTSDLLAPKSSSKNTATSTTKATGGNAHKVHISATNSHFRAPNSGLSDLEYALRALELTTNPTLNNTQKRIKCNCQATKHDLLLAAPNCLSCGKIICIKEGPGPCTFCGTPLLSSSETQDMISFLREERGREKMQADNRANRKADVGRGSTKAYSQPHGAVPPQLGLGYGVPAGPSTVDEDAAALQRAREHRDKLLAFQASNAQRTKIIDEAADFDTSAISSGGYSGLNMWATPEERALQLKKQQKRMRELEWAGKEAWEKRKVVVSIDISGKGKGAVVRREMKELEMHEVMNSDDDDVVEDIRATGVGGEGNSGVNQNRVGQYSRNPLLKGLVRPVFIPPEPKKPKLQHPAKDENLGNSNIDNNDKNRGKGKEKPKARQINDDYTFTGQVDDYDDGYDYNDDDDDELYDNYELPDIVKQRMRDAKMGRVGGSGGGGWKRVLQDEQEVKDNEKWILDGGRSGGGLDGAGGAGDSVDTNIAEGPECG